LSGVVALANSQKVVICDIDGTIAIRQSRGPFEFQRVDEDKPNDAVVELLRLLKRDGYTIVFLSGRPDSCRGATEIWLDTHVIPGEQLVMRKAGDNRSDEIVKLELFRQICNDPTEVFLVFDDRNKVVDMWRSIGLTCLQVAEGDF